MGFFQLKWNIWCQGHPLYQHLCLPPTAPIAPALLDAAAFSQAAAKNQKRSSEMSWVYLFPFNSMFTSSLHLCWSSFYKGSTDTFASQPHKSNWVNPRETKLFGSFEAKFWQLQVLTFARLESGEPFLWTAPDFKNWNRADPITTVWFIHTTFSFLSSLKQSCFCIVQGFIVKGSCSSWIVVPNMLLSSFAAITRDCPRGGGG